MGLILGGAGRGFPLGNAISSQLSASNYDCIKIGTPFMSGAGLDALVTGISVSAWTHHAKNWLVGLHGGVTEPAALRKLINLPNSVVRVFTNTGAITSAELKSRPLFHAKVIAFERNGQPSNQIVSAIVASANVTAAALSSSNVATNFEAGADVAISTPDERAAWAAWWRSAWLKGLRPRCGPHPNL